MKLVIGRDIFFEGLQRVFNVVPQKPTLPVLTNFLLSASSDRLSISGTDMDMSITTTIKCSVLSAGAVTVNAKRFFEIIRELPDGDVEIDVENERITISFAHGKSIIMGMPAANYPSLKDSIDGVSVSISGSDFVKMVDKAGFTVSSDRSRVSLTGVYWKVSSDEIVMVSTDGHRLSLFSKRVSVETEKVSEAIIPPKALNHAVRIFEDDVKLEKIMFGERAITFNFADTFLFSKLIEGSFPNYWQVIPANNSKKVYVSTEKLISVVKRVAVLSNAITHRVGFSLSSDMMEITTTNVDIGGEANESLEVKYEGEPLSTGFNANFFLEILRKIDSKEVLIELETPGGPCLLKPMDKKENEEIIYLIMPLRLNEEQ